uniref:Uncharacterized protein n=1 Tax=Siphoviridae sp. ctGyV19 TaxID=2826225 RepID=A0A8S5MW57_9CAUD|nr:MAG TPA: hypothetical protein [Siphoviridae sp. ctGyV19]
MFWGSIAFRRSGTSGIGPEPRARPCPSAIDGMLHTLHRNTLCGTVLLSQTWDIAA